MPATPTLIPAAAGGALAAGVGAAVLLSLAPPVALVGGLLAVLAGGAATAGLRRGPASPPRLDLPAAPTSDELLAAVDRVEDETVGKVPPVVAARVGRICAIVRDTIPRLDHLGAGSSQAHSVVATATSYLPEAVGAYLRLPRSWADKRPVSGGKTSLMVLCDQLDLLAVHMDKIFDAVCRSDADALVAHAAFLREKFGSGAIDIGGAGAPGAPVGEGPERS
jgi:hypothetical protein